MPVRLPVAMVVRCTALVILTACGRIGFDPVPLPAMPACAQRTYPDVPWLLDASGGKVALADVDGDGNLDIVTVDDMAALVRVSLGDGRGTFAPTVSGGPAYALVVADFNGDGVLDVATSDYMTPAIRVQLGLGDGTFGPPVVTVGAPRVGTFVAADLDGDGKTDLVYPSNGGAIFLHGLGDGSFAQSTPLTSTSVSAIAVADLDGDGTRDVIVIEDSIHAIGLLLGDGSGGFQPRRDFATNATITYTVVAAGDLDGDGFADVVVADLGNTVSVLYGNGDGTLAAQADYTTVGDVGFGFALGDVTGDGLVDIVLDDQGEDITTLLANRGDRTFDVRELYVGAQPSAVALGDLDHDGHLDLVAALGPIDGPVSITLGTPTGLDVVSRYPAAASLDAVAVADFNGDGAMDVVAVSSSGPNIAQIWYGVGDGTFGAAVDVLGTTRGFDVRTADLDRDGLPDFVFVGASGLFVARNTGSGAFAISGPLALPQTATSVALADLNGDGVLDLIVPVAPADRVSIFLGAGDGTFGPSNDIVSGTGATDVAVGDLDHDGIPDLVIADSGAKQLELWSGVGDGTFRNMRYVVLPDLARSVTAGDFDNDGNLDVAATFGTSMLGVVSVAILRGDGTGQLAQTAIVPAGPLYGLSATTLVGTSIDLYGWNSNYNSLDVFFGNGDGTFQPRRSYASGSYGGRGVAANLDGKNGLDFVVANDHAIAVRLDACP